jgi:hypothetical protein
MDTDESIPASLKLFRDNAMNVITVSRPITGVVNRDEYITAGGGKAVKFETVKKAINFLADLNYTIADLRELDFNLEEQCDDVFPNY